MKTYKNRQLQGHEMIKDSFVKINENSKEANSDITELYQQDEALQQQINAMTISGSADILRGVFSVEAAGENNAYQANYASFAPFRNLKLAVTFGEENTGMATLNFNGSGAKAIKIDGREVKAKELKGLTFLQYTGIDWEVMDNAGLREDITKLENDKLGKMERAADSANLAGKAGSEYAEAAKVLSLETQLLQAQSDIQNLTQQLNNKADKHSEYHLTKDFNELTKEGNYVVRNKSLNQPFVSPEQDVYHWSVSVKFGNATNPDGTSDVFYQVALTMNKPDSIFIRRCINNVFWGWIEK